MLQSNLKWNVHVDKVLSSCVKLLAIIKFLRSTWWGSDPSLLLTLYKGLIRSTIEYGAFVWFNIPQYLKTKLDTLQNQAIRIAMGYRKSTPINIMLVEAKELCLEDRFKFLGCNFVSRVFTRNNHTLISIFENIQAFMDCPTNVIKFPLPFIFNCFLINSQQAHLTFNSDIPVDFLYPLTLKQFILQVSFAEGKLIQVDPFPATSFARFFP